jgi:head-tail adaptor
MAVNERSRRMLYDRLEEVLGVGQGDALMEYLPPVGWSDVATRRDVEGVKAELAHRFARVDDRFEAAEADLAHRFARVDDRFEAAEADLAHRFARVDDRFAAEITAAFRGEITAAMTLQTRQTIFAVIGVLLAAAALVAAGLGLG